MTPVLIFRVVGHLCGIRADVVEEVVHIAATVQIPGQPSLLDGFLNLRARQIPVLPLSRLFGLSEESPGLYAPIIVVRMGIGSTGLLATSVTGVTQADETLVQALSAEDSLNACADGQIESEYGTVILLCTGRILLEKEARCIAELTERANSRLAELDGPAA